MSKELINPNWHVILIHYPLGVFVLGMILELIFLVLRYHGTIRLAARWMIVLGALSTLPAAYSGLYAMSDVARRTAPDVPDDAPWHVVTGNSMITPAQWEMLDSHVWSNAGSAVLAVMAVTIAVACTDRWRQRLYPVFLVVLLASLAGMTRGAWYGGEMVYREGVAVRLPYKDDEATAKPEPAGAAATRPDSPAAETQVEKASGLDWGINPAQLHVTLAGVAAAMGMLGIGLSLRAASTSPHWRDPELDRAGVSAMPNPTRGGAEDLAVLRSFAPQVEVTHEGAEHVPAARYWLLTFLVSAAASLAGWWLLGDEQETYNPTHLWQLVMTEGYVRRMAHVIAAGAIVILPLFMAVLARVARRSRGTAAIFSLLLVLALAAQVWVGVLLLFDQPKVGRDAGPWYRFQRGTATSSVPDATMASPAPTTSPTS